MLEDKGNPSEFNSCYAINVFDFVMQQNPKGPYKENEGKDGKWCDLMKKKMRGKTRPWEAKLMNCFFRENFNPPWWWKKEVGLKTINQALVGRQPNQNRFVFFSTLLFILHLVFSLFLYLCMCTLDFFHFCMISFTLGTM